MRIFIGFKYQTGDGEQKYVPVMYGDMTRQVANIIKENSENKMLTVPKIACYMSNLELDTKRISDPTFVSKIQVRERDYVTNDGVRTYDNVQGGTYTIERLMPTPYTLTLKADIWTANTDQKLQLLEQILVMFNPSLDLQTNDNYPDWTSLTSLDLTGVTISSRSIPQGNETEIDIASLEFKTNIWISPPAKVKKLGIVKNIIMNVFTDTGGLLDLETLVYNGNKPNAQIRASVNQFGVYLIKNVTTGSYECTSLDYGEVKQSLDNATLKKVGLRELDWYAILDIHGKPTSTSRIFFSQPSGYEVSGTFAINELNPTHLIVDLDIDTIPSNTEPAITAIVNPSRFSPIIKFGSLANIPAGTRYLMLDSIGVDDNEDNPDAWKNLNGTDNVIYANSIIEWNGSAWEQTFDPKTTGTKYVTNLTTGIQYKWESGGWLKSFEGEYAAGYWRIELDT